MSEPTTQLFHRLTFSNRMATIFAATRPAFLTASLLPVLVGLALAWGESGRLDVVLGVATLLNIALIHSGANVLNDYFDARNGTDGANRARIFPFSGGSRFIQNGVLSEAETVRLGGFLMAAGAALGLLLAWIGGPPLLLIGVAGGLMAIFYSAPPCLACRGLGDGVIALCFGVLPVVGTVWLQRGEFEVDALWAGAVVGCFVAAILWINSIPDIAADQAAGKRTLPVRLGPELARWGLPTLFGLGFLLLLISPLPGATRLALLAIAPALWATQTLLRGELIPAIPLTLATHASCCILLAAGFLWAGG